MESIIFNGKVYNTLDEMPADQRAAYEGIMAFMKDENHNGIPDQFEGDALQKMMTMVNTSVIVNGQPMQSFESLPPEARAKFEKAMAKLGQIGITPSAFVSAGITKSEPQIAPSEPAFTQSPPFIQSSSSVITEDTGSRTGIIIIAVLSLLLLCALAAVGFLLLNR